MKKEMESFKVLFGKLEEPFKAIVEVGEAAKKRAIQQLVSDIIKPVDEGSQMATQRLVESLMKF